MPAENGVSQTISPGTMIGGKHPPDYSKITKLDFGDYVQVHIPRQRTNNNELRRVGAIVLYRMENGQDS